MKKNRLISAIAAAAVCVLLIVTAGCGANSSKTISVFNWGEYIDEDLLTEFEQETGIHVNYSTAPTAEEMYAKMKGGGVKYDLVVPCDYMVSRMIEEDMLEKIDFTNIPNYKYIDSGLENLEYDPNNEYSVPYQWGTVGIVYNKNVVNEEDTGSWDLLWNTKYADQILMFDNVRDAMGIALKRLGASYNTTDEKILNQAADMLIEQKPIVQAYVMDQIFDKMESGEAAIASCYTGDYFLMLNEIEDESIDLGYYTPKEGSNFYVDAMCIQKGAVNKAGAEKFIDFLLRPENMARNTQVVSYSSPETAARELLPDEMKNNDIMYPSEEELKANFEVFTNLPEKTRELYDELWVKIMTS